jgi:RNA polymerase sigma-70 factor (ECF subfamily)
MQSKPEESDADLLRRMERGDRQAFATLYRRHQSALYRFALQMSGEPGIAEEVTQDVFLLLMRDAKSYDPARGPLPSYLYGVARNYVYRALRRERPYAASLDDQDAAEFVEPSEDALSGLTRAQQMDALRRAILSLPEAYREAVVLCELHELDYAAAASAIGCPVGTVRSRLHRARALLLEKMRERCPA